MDRSSPTDADATTGRESWADRAVHYAEDFGWQIVPLEVNSNGSPAYSDDPVEQQLGAFVYVEYPEEAASTVEGIEQLGTEYPVAFIGAVTGKGSDLLAIEVKRKKSALRERIEELADGAPQVLGTKREYFLFSYPSTEEPIPALTPEDEAVLHGEGSVIRLPWRYYRWSLDGGTAPADPDEELLSIFGVDGTGDATEKREDESDPQMTLPLESPSPDDDASGEQSSSSRVRADSRFRSGEELRLRPVEKASLEIPWLVPGGFSLLTGSPKTAGKSTWALNLAAHLAAGEPFLEVDTEPSDVVMLADTSPTGFRSLLERIDILEEDDLSRLHVLHPRDVADLDWHMTLQRAYRQSEDVDARLVIVDCLDQYVRLKGGRSPIEDEEVVHALTAEIPSECAVLGVKSIDTARGSIAETINRLGLLGRMAHIVLRLQNISNSRFPSLRELHTVSRTGTPASTMCCALQGGRYERMQRAERERLTSQEEGGPSEKRVAMPPSTEGEAVTGSDPSLLSQ